MRNRKRRTGKNPSAPNHSLALPYAKLHPWESEIWDGYELKNLVVTAMERRHLDEKGGT